MLNTAGRMGTAAKVSSSPVMGPRQCSVAIDIAGVGPPPATSSAEEVNNVAGTGMGLTLLGRGGLLRLACDVWAKTFCSSMAPWRSCESTNCTAGLASLPNLRLGDERLGALCVGDERVGERLASRLVDAGTGTGLTLLGRGGFQRVACIILL